MTMYNSFYGGRRGTSFVIVKNYLDIPQMVNNFARGNDYTEVGFEEYVIINNPNKNHPDNGKIFRRGYDFNSNKTISGYVLVNKNDNSIVISSDSAEYEAALESQDYEFQFIENIQAHGAEYIGNIIGPAGKAPLLNMTSYESVQNMAAAEGFKNRRSSGLYSPSETNPGLIPGKDKNGNYHDAIEWQCYSVSMDKFADETQAYIGFKFPYLVTQMQTQQVEPYDGNGDAVDMSSIARSNDDPGTHPYYNKWHLKIPKGIPGDALRNLRIATFKTYIRSDISNSIQKDNVLYYGEEQVLIDPSDTNPDLTYFTEKYNITIPQNPEQGRLNWLLDQTPVGNKAILVYEKYNFDSKRDGEVKYYYLGDYNEIESISLSRDGRLICTLAHDGEKVLNTDRIKWISSIELEVPELVTTEPTTIIEEGQQIIVPGSTYIDFKDEVTNNFTVSYNEGSVSEFNIPFVKRIQYDDRTGGLYYQLAGIHSGEDENGNIDGIHLTTLEYVKDAQYDQGLDQIVFLKNTYIQEQDQGEDPRKIVIPIPAIKRIKIENKEIDEELKPCLIAQYQNKDEEIIAESFDYLESFNYDNSDGSLNYKKKSGNVAEKHIIPFVDKLQYNDKTAKIRYHVNGAEATQYEDLEGNLPIIKKFEIDDDTKGIYVQFGTAFNAFDTTIDEEGNNPYRIPDEKQGKYDPNDHWYRIGSTVSQQVVIGGILTNKTLNDLNISDYEGAESYSSESDNPVVDALNELYPNGRVDDQDTSLRVITVGRENEFKEYYAYDWMRNRIVSQEDEVTYSGSWYFLGSIRAINNVNLIKKGTNPTQDVTNETLFLTYSEDICSISIVDNTEECNTKNPMTRIQSNHKYINTITGSFSEVTVQVGQNIINTYTPNNNQVSFEIPAASVTGDILIIIN